MPKLTPDQLTAALKNLPTWTQTGDEIVRQFEFADFLGSMAFVDKVAEVAQAADHHPDIDIRYDKVKIALSTHDQGGITEKDAALAEQIDSLA